MSVGYKETLSEAGDEFTIEVSEDSCAADITVSNKAAFTLEALTKIQGMMERAENRIRHNNCDA